MTKDKKSFSHLKVKDIQVKIKLGDDAKYEARGVSIVNFQKESSNPLQHKDVLYVPGLTQNLVSVATLEDKEYDIIFKR